jgi:hypothetical protein
LDAYAWFAARRGIRRETLDAFGVEVDGTTVRFPYPGGATKTRVGLEKDDEGGRKFFWDPPGMAGQVPFLTPGHSKGCDRAILVEGETDTLALYQAMPEELRGKVAIIGLSGTNAWKERYVEEHFADTSRVFVVFDADDPYENPDASKQTEKSWLQVKKDLGRKARRVRLPQGINDVAEFFQRYDWAAFQVLLKQAAEPKRHYKRLDLSQPIPQTDWVVEDLAVGGEAWVVAGDGGVGKSMLTMALALAVAGGDATFLGKRIMKHGPVLYVDEENSAALAVQRLNALTAPDPTPDLAETPWLRKPTITDEQAKNLEYLWYAGVDLLGAPELLHEEALEIQPVLVVVDSLSRVSLGGEENNNDAMTQLMRAGVIPIARDTGAAVLILHHTDKEGRGPRGASSIRNTSDLTLSIVETDSGRKRIFPSKPRRATGELGFEIQGDLATDGWLRLVDPYDNTPM